MSRRRRQEEIEDLETPTLEEAGEVVEEQSKPKMPFSVWFDRLVKAGKIRDYQDEALLVFFKKKGLKSSEDVDTYNKAFENF